MPIYEFKCAACGLVFERLQKLSDADPTDCPDCGAAQVRRQLTAPAFRLAGSGWYETDFKKDSDKKANLATRDEAPKSESSSSESGNADSGQSESGKSDQGKAETSKSESSKSGSSPSEAPKSGGAKPASSASGANPAAPKPATVTKPSD